MFGNMLADVKIVLALFLFGVVLYGKDISQVTWSQSLVIRPHAHVRNAFVCFSVARNAKRRRSRNVAVIL